MRQVSEQSAAVVKEFAREQLAELVRKALVALTRRIPTKVSANQKRKRVEAKKDRGEVEEGRGWER